MTSKDQQNELPEPEELTGIDADPPLTRDELKELGDIIGRSKEAGELSPEDRKKAQALLGRFKYLK